MHAARALWALGLPYDLLYIAPSYLVQHIERSAREYGASSVTQFGVVSGSPNVMLIGEPTEAGPQDYDFLLRDEYECTLDPSKIEDATSDEGVTDILLFPSEFDIAIVLAACSSTKAKIYIDVENGIKDLAALSALTQKFDTVILSTSADLFLKKHGASVSDLCGALLGKYCNSFLFKENRGGARFYAESDPGAPIRVEAQVRSIVHSVGVGDCFDVAFVALRHQYSDDVALTYASWIAAEYASTTYPVDFKQRCDNTLSIEPEILLQLKGISLPWEERPSTHIYIAAPDFSFVDRTPIDQIANCLRYHNFVPRLPVREHGQMEADASLLRKEQLYVSDMELLNECGLVLAVLIDNDPGTLIEIGWAAGQGKPTIIYDPYHKAENLMLTQMPDLVSSSLDGVISKVFQLLARKER
jgi:nucleoside 2-deoxyribosyltransferase/sugar/nucleoside kinase (ribokinase family)